MSEHQSQTHDDGKKGQPAERQQAQPTADTNALLLLGLTTTTSRPTSLADNQRLNGRGNQPVKIALMQQMQRTYGNRATQRMLNRTNPTRANVRPMAHSLPPATLDSGPTQSFLQRQKGGAADTTSAPTIQRTTFTHNNQQKDTDDLTVEQLAKLLDDDSLGDQKEIIKKAVSARMLESVGTLPESMPTGVLREILDEFNITLSQFTRQENPQAENALKEYIDRQGETGKADAKLLQSLLAMTELHKGKHFDHILTQEEGTHNPAASKLLKLAELSEDEQKMILDTYQLTEKERTAIKHYTNAHTNERMGESFEENVPVGWANLSSALEKLPSTGQLGLRHTTFRVPREKEGDLITKLEPGTQVRHGHQLMEHQQRHFLSTATTYNVHTTPNRIGQAGSIMGITGTSGRYVNPFGVMSTMTDGAEVLYPPGTVTKYEGTRTARPKGLPVHYFDEIDPTDDIGPNIVEDKDYQPIRVPPSGHPTPSLDMPIGAPYDPRDAEIPQRSTIRKRRTIRKP